MAYCLPKFYSDKFIDALRNGKVDPAKLSDMTSAERRSFFDSLVGKENSIAVNALFESKLLLKNQQAGLITWAKKTAGLSEPVRRDIISKIERMNTVLDATTADAFFKDLASQKFGAEVTFEEAKKIVESAREIEKSKAKIRADEPLRSSNRVEYGLQLALLKEYIGELKLKANKVSLGELSLLRAGTEIFNKLSGAAKSILSSLDNSFFGRQGIKMLFDPLTSHVWARNFLTSFRDIYKEMKGHDAMIPIKADIFSRPNALNGKYEASKVAIGIGTEEAFPSSLPTKIPLIGRLFKASETAYNGAALRLRADYADILIKQMEDHGIDILRDKKEALDMGEFVNFSTGRGSLGKGEIIARETNLLAFSIKFLKSNIDTLLAPVNLLDKNATYAKRLAGMKTLRIIGMLSGIMAMSEALWPGSVETDPRSSHFGKIKVGNRWFDISGGMASLVILASRLTPSYHNGKFGFWAKGPTGKYMQLGTGKFGSLTPLDYLESFLEGKASPLLGTIMTVLRQRDFSGNKPTPGSVVKGLVTPLPLQTYQQIQKNLPEDPMVTAIMMALEELGLSSSK